jgi:phage shock protein C
MTDTATYRRLFRSRHDKKLAGVCGGFAQYLNIDPVAARVLFAILLAITGGGAFIAYVVAWILMPEEPAPANPIPSPTHQPPEANNPWPTATAGAPSA